MERYTPQPMHIYLAVPLILGGAALLPLQWQWMIAGICLILAGIGLGCWIVMAGINISAAEYYEKKAEMLNALANSRDPELWMQFGLQPPPMKQPSMLPVSDTHTKLIEFPIAGAVLTLFADGILQGKGLADEDWAPHVMSDKKIRAMKKVMKEHQLIKEKIKGAPTQGYILTRLGRTEMLKYASMSIQQLFATREKDTGKETPQLTEGAM